MRCRDTVLRNGYYTGRRCFNPARWLVDGVAVCGTHRNVRMKAPGEHTLEEIHRERR